MTKYCPKKADVWILHHGWEMRLHVFPKLIVELFPADSSLNQFGVQYTILTDSRANIFPFIALTKTSSGHSKTAITAGGLSYRPATSLCLTQAKERTHERWDGTREPHGAVLYVTTNLYRDQRLWRSSAYIETKSRWSAIVGCCSYALVSSDIEISISV